MGSIRSPYTKLKFIDKCIAASLYYEIKPIVLFNKIDLINKKEEKKLKNHKTLLIGNSGIGKSSLINFLTGVKNQRTDKLSTKTGRGKQTTTFSEIFNIKNNSSVVDTPGFKDFYFHDIEKSDLKFLYPEFKTKNNQCKFNNCNHINEPGCIIKKNVGETISERRYNNYLSIIDELD